MPDHVHEWYVDQPSSLFPFRCKHDDCGDGMTLGAAASSLNATEKLSAEKATDARVRILSEWDCEGQSEPTCDALEAYAAALEKD